MLATPATRRAMLRSFSTSASRRSVLDYFKFFKKKTAPGADSAAPAVKDTNQVIKEVQASQDALPVSDKVEILGRKNPRYTDKAIIEKNLNGFNVSRWFPKRSQVTDSLTADNYQEQISATLQQIFKASSIDVNSPITDLHAKFTLFKSIQTSFAISIPDSKFTLLNTFQDLQAYLNEHLDPLLKLSNKTEFKPDAVDFAPGIFEGTNVYTGKWTFNSEKEKAYKKVLRKASKLEKQSVREYNSNNSNNNQ